MGTRQGPCPHRRAAAVALLIACAALAVVAPTAGAKKKRNLGPVATAFATAAMNPNVPASATASCPEGKEAVGGGFVAPFNGVDVVTVFSSLRDGDSAWTSTAVGPTGQVLTGHVYCRRVRKPVRDVTSVASVAPRSEFSTAATCPGSKQKLIAGGFSSALGRTPAHRLVPTGSAASGKSWIYSGYNNFDQTLTAVSHAYCTKGVRKAGVVSASNSTIAASNASWSTFSPECGRKKRLSAGGFIISPTNPSGPVNPIPLESRISDDTWLASAINFAGAPGQLAVVSQGICTR